MQDKAWDATQKKIGFVELGKSRLGCKSYHTPRRADSSEPARNRRCGKNSATSKDMLASRIRRSIHCIAERRYCEIESQRQLLGRAGSDPVICSQLYPSSTSINLEMECQKEWNGDGIREGGEEVVKSWKESIECPFQRIFYTVMGSTSSLNFACAPRCHRTVGHQREQLLLRQGQDRRLASAESNPKHQCVDRQ